METNLPILLGIDPTPQEGSADDKINADPTAKAIHDIQEASPNTPEKKSGRHLLQKLRPHHYRVVHMYLSGMKPRDISIKVKMPYGSVWRILSDPLVKDLIQRILKFNDDRLKLLTEKSVDAIEAALDTGQPMSTRLKAARMQLETQGKFKGPEDDGKKTAEDVVSQILNMQVNVNVK